MRERNYDINIYCCLPMPAINKLSAGVAGMCLQKKIITVPKGA